MVQSPFWPLKFTMFGGNMFTCFNVLTLMLMEESHMGQNGSSSSPKLDRCIQKLTTKFWVHWYFMHLTLIDISPN